LRRLLGARPDRRPARSGRPSAGRTWHGLLDPRLIGVHFMALIVGAGLCGAIGAWFGYRKAMGSGLF
jgi:hypothetical protein